MTSPQRTIIHPQGAIDPQFVEASTGMLRGVLWLVLGSSAIGDLALAFRAPLTSMHLAFGVVTMMSFVALAIQYADRSG